MMIVKNSHNSDCGFTIIELLVVMATMSILSANFIITAREYYLAAYKAVQISQAHDLRTALEMGASDMDERGWEHLNYGEEGPAAYTGRIRDTTEVCWNPELCRGFRAAKNVVAGASYDPVCQSSGPDGCVLYHVFVAHAKRCTIYQLISQKNGPTIEIETPTSLCPGAGVGGGGDPVDAVASSLPAGGNGGDVGGGEIGAGEPGDGGEVGGDGKDLRPK